MAKDKGGHGSEKHGGASAVTAPAYEGKPTWHGVAGGKKVTNSAGNPIAYASPEAAVAGANSVGGPSIRSSDRTSFGGGQPVASNAHAAATLAGGGAKSAPVPVHGGAAGRSQSFTDIQAALNRGGGQKPITIFHQDGEYAVPIPGNRGHSFTNDKADAEGTARAMHGDNITIKHRAKSWGPEMD